MQLTRNIPKNDKQHILEIIIWRSTCKLHEWLCNTGQDQEIIREKVNAILEGSKRYNLYFKQSKCNFDAEEIPILGIVVE